mmetsp:Transcript_9541/g.41777  ORF Transcript_9541/g.41777 Transcript_9541/m.41777 type:complete len:203 (+) Transcript_9541:816-1424(+)
MRFAPSSPGAFATIPAAPILRRSNRCSGASTRRHWRKPEPPRSWSSKPSPTSRPARPEAREAPRWSSSARLPAATARRRGPVGDHLGRTKRRTPRRIQAWAAAPPAARSRPVDPRRRRVCWPCAPPPPSRFSPPAWRLANPPWLTPTRRGRASGRFSTPPRMTGWRRRPRRSRRYFCCGKNPRDGPRRRPPRRDPCTPSGTR